jgi:hypothetical protein
MLALVTAGVFFTATFLAALMAVAVAWMVLERRSAQLAENRSTLGGSPNGEASSLLRNESLSTISVVASLLGQFDFAHLLQEHLEQAGLNWTVGRLTSMMLLAGAVGLV